MKYILFVGTLMPRKNLVALIEAFSHFASGSAGDTVSDYKLVIAGACGWGTEEIFKAPGKYGVQERVIFTGRVTEHALRTLYQGASVYVQPSLTEGFGLPVLEAMAAGVPVIVSDGGALKEVVGRAGIVVALGSHFVKNLSRALAALIRDQNAQKLLVAMGLERVKYFTWDRAAKSTLEVLVG